MKLEEAIKKAIEGGWETPDSPASMIVADHLRIAPYKAHPLEIASHYPELAFVDASFWQSLGKAMGWHERQEVEYSLPLDDEDKRKALIDLENNVGVNSLSVFIIFEWNLFLQYVSTPLGSSVLIEWIRRGFSGS